MTLDFVILRPEFFLLFSFLIQQRYGTGGLVTPVAEQITIADENQKEKKDSNGSGSFLDGTMNALKHPTAGPNHAASAQCSWAVFWCILCSLLMFYGPLQSVFQGGCFQKDAYSLQQCGILFQTATFVLRVSLGWQKTASISHTEYVYLAMLALMGQYMLLQRTDLMAMYLCLEQQSFSLVVLCGQNYKSAYSIEAAMKYFQLSAFRSCQLQQGIGFIYWQTGETTLSHIENLAFRTQTEPSLLLQQGIWLVTMGLLWKQAAAPLHFWVPDVYMGAWSSVSQWITVLPKIAVLGFWTHHWHQQWVISFGNTQVLFRTLSMIIGSLAPQAQTRQKRLLAYSSIGHMGQLLMPLCGPASVPGGQVSGAGTEQNGQQDLTSAAHSQDAIGAQWTHMFIYIIINLGTWALLMWPMTRPQQPSGTGRKAAGPQYIWDLKAQNQSSRTAAFRWAVFMTSQAGLPPVYGFLGKAGIIWTALNNGQQIPVAVAQVTTQIGSVYYLKVQKVCYVDTATSWATYEKTSSVTAYIIARSAAFQLIGQWHGNSMFQATHLLALKVSTNSMYLYSRAF